MNLTKIIALSGALLFGLLAIFGIFTPALISSKSTELVVLGLFVVFATVVALTEFVRRVLGLNSQEEKK